MVRRMTKSPETAQHCYITGGMRMSADVRSWAMVQRISIITIIPPMARITTVQALPELSAVTVRIWFLKITISMATPYSKP